jgi:hypothetical protein
MQRTGRGVEVWIGLVAINLPREDLCRPWAESACWDASAESDELIFMDS